MNLWLTSPPRLGLSPIYASLRRIWYLLRDLQVKEVELKANVWKSRRQKAVRFLCAFFNTICDAFSVVVCCIRVPLVLKFYPETNDEITSPTRYSNFISLLTSFTVEVHKKTERFGATFSF